MKTDEEINSAAKLKYPDPSFDYRTTREDELTKMQQTHYTFLSRSGYVAGYKQALSDQSTGRVAIYKSGYKQAVLDMQSEQRCTCEGLRVPDDEFSDMCAKCGKDFILLP